MTPPTGPTPEQVEAAFRGNCTCALMGGCNCTEFHRETLALALRDAWGEINRLKDIVAGCHESLGESSVSDDKSLPYAIRCHILEAKVRIDELNSEIERLKAEQGYDCHAALEAGLATERKAREEA